MNRRGTQPATRAYRKSASSNGPLVRGPFDKPHTAGDRQSRSPWSLRRPAHSRGVAGARNCLLPSGTHSPHTERRKPSATGSPSSAPARTTNPQRGNPQQVISRMPGTRKCPRTRRCSSATAGWAACWRRCTTAHQSGIGRPVFERRGARTERRPCAARNRAGAPWGIRPRARAGRRPGRHRQPWV